jgi:predicted nucleic acid-binding Zn ribbon protein
VRPIAHAVPAALIELLRTTPLSDGKVTFAWRTAVGPAVDRATAVKLDRGVLIVETASQQWAHEVRRSTSIILTRLQGLLGPETILRIEVRMNPNLKSAI